MNPPGRDQPNVWEGMCPQIPQNHCTMGVALPAGKGTSAALQAWRSRRGALLDITSLPDAEPLTQKVGEGGGRAGGRVSRRADVL